MSQQKFSVQLSKQELHRVLASAVGKFDYQVTMTDESVTVELIRVAEPPVTRKTGIVRSSREAMVMTVIFCSIVGLGLETWQRAGEQRAGEQKAKAVAHERAAELDLYKRTLLECQQRVERADRVSQQCESRRQQDISDAFVLRMEAR